MAKNSTVNLLPEYFQTQTNKQVLAATLDQLTQEPQYVKSQGYVGRKVGPGVIPSDQYINEPTDDRLDYQLEPGVVKLEPGTSKVIDAITYPGINDSIEMQGGFTNNADRLYKSEYYAWDAFIDYDKMVNFTEYYWLPYGVLSVDVYATGIPTNKNYVITRENDGYTFSGENVKNPSLNLARGGTYTFQIAQESTSTTNFLVGNNGPNYYFIDYQINPTLTFVRGNTYILNINVKDGIYPLYIKSEPSLGTTNIYSEGVYNNGAVAGFLKFTVPQDAPDTLYYCCSTVENMRGEIKIEDAVPGNGPKFWIQSEPGISGTLTYAPNISSRNVLGVENNGIDLGTVTFKVPDKLEQIRFYNMVDGGFIDLVSSKIPYSDLIGKTVAEFLITYPTGVDGITDLDRRTIIFADGSSPQVAIYQIQYINSGSETIIDLYPISITANETQFYINFGNQWAQTQWYKDDIWLEVPALTAILDTIYYQDSVNPELFGYFNLIEQDNTATIDVNDILGQKNYTSPNGVVFTNGLTIKFVGPTIPSSYSGNTYAIEGVGESITLTNIRNLVTPELFNKRIPIPYDFEPYDIGPYDGFYTIPYPANYVTINRASTDLNVWSRNNRWFHVDVIKASYAYNNLPLKLVPSTRASRPILEFRAGLRLFNFGTQGIGAINVIDFGQTNAFANVEGATEYKVDGYGLTEGSLVIFPNDEELNVRNNVYQVTLIMPDTVEPIIAQPIIHLTLARQVIVDDTTVCLSGNTQTGVSYWFNGITWLKSQQETAINFPNPGAWPLFDVYDKNGISFGDKTIYASSTFQGSYLFSYALSTSTVVDSILGFNLAYYSLNNIGDIVFNNNLYTDTFNYISNNQGQIGQVSDGFVRQYSDRTSYELYIGWQTAITPSISRQQFQRKYDTFPIQLDVAVTSDLTVPPIQLFVNNFYIEPNQYTWETTENTTTIFLNDTYVLDSIIEIDVISSQVSDEAFYVVPVNLENNPLNGNPKTITLGTVRSHYQSICTNLINISGPINGANNTRDLGNLVPYGLQILQQSSPLTMAGYFMRSEEYDIFQALPYNSRQYSTFKTKLLQYPIVNDLMGMSASDIIDEAIAYYATGKTENDPFYWSDMLPWGNDYTLTQYTVNPITGKTFNTIQTYTFTSANYLGLLVYYTTIVDNQQITKLLEKNYDYTVSPDSPQITLLFDLTIGSIVSIREYSSTFGSFIPNTPSKMGLYPKYQPAMYLDTSYVHPQMVIRGHDGSITIAFGDIRDQVLLEFETRIYNNIKVDDNPIPLVADEVIPGFFRMTEYSREEILEILGVDFLSWVGWNKIGYTTQDFIPGNEFTYNYSSSGSKLTPQKQISNTYEIPLPGAWRGIYAYFYDCMEPNLRPWEMLGFSEEPSWWANRYSAAPYTNGNFVLWDDLQAGYIADPVAPYINPLYARPNLNYVIPAGSQGELLPPLESVVGQSNPITFQKSWTVGDGGPTEAAWWTSSSYPFAVMRLLALTKPAQFFSLFADRDLYRYDTNMGQYLYNGRYRLDANGVQVYGNGISKASFINWIVDYNRQLGINSTNTLTTALQNLDVRLCYRMAGYTDKSYTSVVIQSSSPNSNNVGLRMPPESYQILMYKNQPFQSLTYSAVVVELAPNGGYTVYGYNNVNPYFEFFVSMSGGAMQTMTSNNVTVQVPSQWTNKVAQIPYGYTFANAAMAVDFILSYGKYLAANGITFTSQQNGVTMDWTQMANEFLYFVGQGWTPGTIMNLNPSALIFTAGQPYSVVDTIESIVPENMVLNQNRQKFSTRNLVVTRLDNSFQIQSATAATISYLRLRFTSYENIMILDNVSIFNDLIYDPITDSRQTRILVSTYLSVWDGTANIPGFIYNDPADIPEWEPHTKYVKGQIVIYKRQYWEALQIVQPAEKFDYTYWAPSNYTKVQTGLLANLANKADELESTYDIHKGALNPDMNLMAFSLIGFNPRPYMTALDLDDVSQVNVYQQFIGTKGTVFATKLFFNANIGRQPSEYSIYENWAILAGTYGANADRSFIDIELNEALLTANPSTIQIISPGQQTVANQNVEYSQLWSTSTVINSPNVFPVSNRNFASTALPSAGYVNVNNVDIMVFNIDDPAEMRQKLNTIGIGTTIWIAKINAYNWGVYNCRAIQAVITSVTDNLNSTSILTFDGPHNLTIGELFVVRYISSTIDGVYRVLGVPEINQVIISYDFISTNQNNITCSGLGLWLESVRVSQPSDISTLSLASSLLAGSIVWVDNNGNGQWEVLQKQSPFITSTSLSQVSAVANSLYGFSLCQNAGYYSALIGAPGTNKVYTYVKGAVTNDAYDFNIVISPTVSDLAEFGYSVVCGQQFWSAIGAPGSIQDRGVVLIQIQEQPNYQYADVQYLIGANAGERFGQSLAMSWDEYWLAVGAPKGNRVDFYGKVVVNREFVTYYGDGTTTTFNYNSSILIDPTKPGQLLILIDGIEMPVENYTLSQGSVIFDSAPEKNVEILIQRRQIIQLDVHEYVVEPYGGTGFGAMYVVRNVHGAYTLTEFNPGINYTEGDTLYVPGDVIGGTTPENDAIIRVLDVTSTGQISQFATDGNGISSQTQFPLRPWFYTISTIESFFVRINGASQLPGIDYTYDVSAGILEFSSLIPQGANITVTTGSWWRKVQSLTMPETDVAAEYGYSLTMTSEGRQLAVGAPNAYSSSPNILRDGATYIYNRSVIRFQVTDVSQTTYIVGAVQEPIQVLLNGVQLTSAALNHNGQFFYVPQTGILSILATLNLGDNIEVGTNQIDLIQKLSLPYQFDIARFGYSMDMSLENDALYIGAPYDGKQIIQAGSLSRFANQSRTYGVTTSINANPTLTAGSSIRINDLPVIIPEDTSIKSVVNAINAANLPNIYAEASNNATYTANGITDIFSYGDLYANCANYNILIMVNGAVAHNWTTIGNNQVKFTPAPSAGSEIVFVGGLITISIINPEGGFLPYSNGKSLLTVLPGIGSAFWDLGFNTFVNVQMIYSPVGSTYGHFGSSVNVDTSSVNLCIGAENGSMYEPTTFDDGATYFDSHSTIFSDIVLNTGVVYTYDYMPSSLSSVSSPGMFIFGQQIWDVAVKPASKFGAAVNYVSGRLLVGLPEIANKSGAVQVYENPTNQPSWAIIQYQQPEVDVSMITSIYSYDKLLYNYQQYFDFINPLQGKILGIAASNINYISAADPAMYNVGPIHNIGLSWAEDHLGEIWWDIENVRFVNPNQDDIVYESRKWGTVFPGSSVDVYQWISDINPPLTYTGPGVPLSTVTYTVKTELNEQGIFVTNYYFWVRGLVSVVPGKTLSTTAISNYIADPRSSGVPFAAILNSSTIAIYNAAEISAEDTILHIEYNQTPNTADIHQEYELIQSGVPTSFINDKLWSKMLDSFCGVDVQGALVPDPRLSPGMRYGVQFRPRQSMFRNRFKALQNYIEFTNNILIQYPMVEMRAFPLLYAHAPIPPQIAESEPDGTVIYNWNKEVANLTELGYQDIQAVPLGYKYLVQSDSEHSGLWTIYSVELTERNIRHFQLAQIENYDVRLYWNFVNWYAAGYNQASPIVATVAYYTELETLSLTQAPVGSSVRVLANAQENWEIYQRNTDFTWKRVGLQNGTIQISDVIWNYALGKFGYDVEVYDVQPYDAEPVIETRYILESINTELFTNELEIYRNDLLILTFQFICTEFEAPSWLFKTSLIDVRHTIRALKQYPNFLPDNQTYVLDYLNEIKPYHCVVRDFDLVYDGLDTWMGTATDFDCPAFWDRSLIPSAFVSPILTPYTHANTTVQSMSSDADANAQIWLETPWKQWFENYTLSVQDVIIINPGSSYMNPPVITVEGNCTLPATLTSTVNSAGQITGITVSNPGSGYITTPTVVIAEPGTTATATCAISSGSVTQVTITYAGSSYMYTPTIIVVGDCVTPAVLQAMADRSGQITAISIINPGSGYAVAPTLIITPPGTAAVAYPVMGNNLIREFEITMKYDRCEYSSDVHPWMADVSYPKNALVRYNNTVWKSDPAAATATCAISELGSVTFVTLVSGGSGSYEEPPVVVVSGDCAIPASFETTINAQGFVTAITLIYPGIGYQLPPTLEMAPPAYVKQPAFDFLGWTIAPASALSAADRTMGYYVPGLNMPGLNLPLLVSGVDYPGVQVIGESYLGFGEEPYNSTPYSIGILSNYPGSFDWGSDQFGIDCYYSSAYTDLYLGKRISDINVTGGAYVDVYSSHAPEELVPGQVFDTLNLMVTSRVGQALPGQNWGMPSIIKSFAYEPNTPIYWGDMAEFISSLVVINQTNGEDLAVGTDYLINWIEQTITVINNVLPNDVITIEAFGFGGGYQLFESYYTSSQIVNTIVVPIAYSSIMEPVIFINGQNIPESEFSYISTGENETTITLVLPLSSTQRLLLLILGPSWTTYNDTVNFAYQQLPPTVTNNVEVDYSWSTAVTEIFTAGSGSQANRYPLSNSTEWTNPVNFICIVGGLRWRGPAASQYIGDGTTIGYSLPDRLDVPPEFILASDVIVYINSILIPQGTLPDQYQVQSGFVVFGSAPAAGVQILVCTTARADVIIENNSLVFPLEAPASDSVIQVITWNDTRQQGISTEVFVGPESGANMLYLNQLVTNTDCLWITVNGSTFVHGANYTLQNTSTDTQIILANELSPGDIVIVTIFTQDMVTQPNDWFIFQDMRGVQVTYTTAQDTVTNTTQDCTNDSDVIYVENAQALPVPDVDKNIWGVVMIGAERVMYRELNTNSISSLLRGTAGTAATSHLSGTSVISMGKEQLAKKAEQNYIVSDSFLANGQTTTFTATNVSVNSTVEFNNRAVQVFVGGTRQTTGYTVNNFQPVTVQFEIAPKNGVEVTILVEKGTWWVNPLPMIVP